MKKKFGCRVYKVSVDANFSCPNIDGKKSTKGCIFCDNKWTSYKSIPIKEQILINIEKRKKIYKAKKFIVYFQSFSNTYGTLEKLKNYYDKAISSHKDIVGLSIATRADCVNEDKIKLIASYKKKVDFVSIEYGMQSCHNKTLKKINRCETFQDFLKAYLLSKKYGIYTCAHIILNLPNESLADQIKTAKIISDLKIEAVKIHILAALKNTELEKMYLKKKWIPYTFEEAIQTTCDFIENLSPTCTIHRVSKTGRYFSIIAPIWMKDKKINVIKSLKQEFLKRNTSQGSKYKN